MLPRNLLKIPMWMMDSQEVKMRMLRGWLGIKMLMEILMEPFQGF